MTITSSSKNISGTVYGHHIDEPETTFLVHVHRGACYNVFYRAPRWEYWNVKAQTEEGALKIAQYHFYNALEIKLVNGPEPATLVL
jgi:hypothetical protein